MKKSKKIFFNLGTLIFALSPATIIMSCGHTSIIPAGDKPIDLSKIKTVKDLIMKINQYTHIIMPKSAVTIGKPSPTQNINPLSDKQIKTLRDYISGITDTKFWFYFNDKHYEMNFSLLKYTKTIIDSIDSIKKSEKEKTLTPKQLHDRIDDRTNKQLSDPLAPNIISLVGITSINIGIDMSGLMELNDNGWNAYNNELTSINSILDPFIHTPLYKEWIKNKTYNLPVVNNNLQGGVNNDGLDVNNQIIEFGGNPKKSNYIKWKPDQEHSFDDHQPKTAPKFSIPMPKNPNQISNFLDQFTFTLLDLYPNN